VTRDAVERHGGTVEKFIRDAVMAVFAVPEKPETLAAEGPRDPARARPERRLRGDRPAGGESLADESSRVGAAEDITTQIYWRVAKARSVACRGDLIEAARIAGEAAELAGDYSSFDGPTGGGRGRSGARP